MLWEVHVQWQGRKEHVGDDEEMPDRILLMHEGSKFAQSVGGKCRLYKKIYHVRRMTTEESASL